MHYNQTDYPINDLALVMLNGNFTTRTERQLHKQKIILKFVTYIRGLNRDLHLLSKYIFSTSYSIFALYLGNFHNSIANNGWRLTAKSSDSQKNPSRLPCTDTWIGFLSLKISSMYGLQRAPVGYGVLHQWKVATLQR